MFNETKGLFLIRVDSRDKTADGNMDYVFY